MSDTSSTSSLQQIYLPAALTGVCCALLQAAITQGVVHGLLIGYAPSLLLFGLGWVRGARVAGLAVLVATLALLLFSPQSAPLFLATDALPVLLILRLSLTYFAFSSGRPSLNAPQEKKGLHLLAAFPTGHVLTALCIYAGLLMTLTAGMIYVGAGDVALPTPEALTQDIVANALPYLRQPGDTPESLAKGMTPLLPLFFGVVLWLWVLWSWGLAALAKFLSETFFVPAPRSLALAPFRTPSWLLGVLALIGIGAVLLASWPGIVLRTSFFLLLLPYFLCGLSHSLPRLPQGRWHRACVFGLAAGLMLFPWGALIFIAIGLLHPLQGRSS